MFNADPVWSLPDHTTDLTLLWPVVNFGAAADAPRDGGPHYREEGTMGALIVRSKAEIPDHDYKRMVLTLMDKQASREVATAEVFGQCVLHAPTIADKIRITRFQQEELKHYQLLASVMTELGVDMEAYIRDRQRAGTPGNKSCLGVGLKTRDSGDVAAAFVDSIRPVMAACGLAFPERRDMPLELPPQVDLSVPRASLA